MTHLRMPQENFSPTISEKRQAASRRNYALFQLVAMRGHFVHVREHLPPELFNRLKSVILDCEAHVKKEIENGKASKK